MKKIYVGIIGLGQIAYGIDKDKKRKIIWSHIGAYKKNRFTKVVAIADSSSELLDQVATETKISSAYTDYKEMLKNNLDLEIVSICTPIFTHIKIIEECLKYKNIKVIFCEKTLSFDYKSAKKIVDKCAEQGVLLVVNHSLRWDSKIQEIKKIIDSQLLGGVNAVIALSNTALFTSASHVIDTLNYLLGSPQTVRGYEQKNFVRIVHGSKDPGSIVTIKYPNNVIVFLKATSKDEKHLMFEMDFEFEEGRVRFYDNFSKIELYRFEKNLENQYYELKIDLANYIKTNQRTLEIIEQIVKYIQTGKNEILSTGFSSLEAILLINKILESSKKDKEIKVW